VAQYIDDGRGYIIGRMKEETELIGSKEEEYRLIELAQKGDVDAQNELITSNLRLVTNIATKFSRFTSVPWNDLYQEGAISLYRAIQKFDTSKGYKFSTYATFWIRQGCHTLIENNNLVWIPTRVQEIYSAYLKIASEFEKEVGKKIPLSDAAELLNVSEKRLEHVLHSSQSILRLESKIDSDNTSGEGSETTFADLIEDTNLEDPIENVALEQVGDEIRRALGTLSESELYVFNSLYDSEKKHKTKLRLVKEGVARSVTEVDTIYRHAVRKLQIYLGDNPLET
jgi:hypothetical protein